MYNVTSKEGVRIYYVMVENTNLIKVYAQSARVVEKTFKGQTIRIWSDELMETRLLPVE